MMMLSFVVFRGNDENVGVWVIENRPFGIDGDGVAPVKK
jgi:hypothetical protein